MPELFLEDEDVRLWHGDVLETLRRLEDVDIPETTLAYLGGLIDGEGYVGVKKSGRTYRERIQVRMVHEEAIKLLAETLGGNYYQEKPNAKNGRPLFCWQASDLRACQILVALIPYLLVKRESALNVLELRRSKNDPRARLRGGPHGRLMPQVVIDDRERIYLRAKALNARGGDAKYGDVPQ